MASHDQDRTVDVCGRCTVIAFKAEASRLRKAGSASAAATNPAAAKGVEADLATLKRKFERGGISEEVYQREKKRIMDEFVKKP